MVVVDDLHAIDPPSLDVLAYGLHRADEHGLTVVACLRPEDADPALLARLAEPAIAATSHTVALDRLGVEATAAMVAAGLGSDASEGLVERLHTESEGLPLLLVEYLRVLIEGRGDASALDAVDAWALPRGAHSLAQARLADVSETARQIASAGAATGRSFDLTTVLHASGRSEDELVTGLEELVTRRLVRELPSEIEVGANAPAVGRQRSTIRYDFVHDKVRAAIYASTSLARRRLLHARIADALAGAVRHDHEAASMAAAIGEHARLGGRDGAAAEWFVLAGDHARSLFANADASAHYEHALALGYVNASSLHARIGDLRMLAGDYTGALDELEIAAAQASDDRELAGIEHQLGSLHLRRGDVRAASTHLEVASRLAATADPGAIPRIEADLGLARLRDLDVAAAELHGERALAAAAASGDVEAEAQARNLLGVAARHRTDIEEARYHLGRASAIAERLDDPDPHIAALNNLALATADAGDLDAATAMLERAVALCAARGDRHREAALRNNLADVRHLAGHDPAAMTELEQAVRLFAGVGDRDRPHPEIWRLVDW